MVIDVFVRLNPVAAVGWMEELAAYRRECAVQTVIVAAHSDDPLAHEVHLNGPWRRAAISSAGLLGLYSVRPNRRDTPAVAMSGAIALQEFAGALFAPREMGCAADDRCLDGCLASLTKLGAPAFFVTGREAAERPALVYAAARRHPELTVVMCRAAQDVHWREALDVAARAQRMQDARLMLETSHGSTREVLQALEAAGSASVMYGSDQGAMSAETRQRQAVLLSEVQAALDPGDFARFASGNAQRVVGALSGCAH